MCNSELQTNRRVSVAIYLRTIINFPLLLYSECRLATTKGNKIQERVYVIHGY